jgi:protein phosphatase
VVLKIPRPALVLLAGISGSGKSTFARRHFRKTEILSSDACRALIADDEADQTATPAAFELLHWIAAERLRRGKLVVVDATNVQDWARASLLEIARERACPAVAIVLDPPFELCVARNQKRKGRVVDATVLAQQAAHLAESRTQFVNEGFAHIYVLSSLDEIESARVSAL